MTVWASYVSGSFDKHNTDFVLAERVGQGEWVGVVLLAFLGLPRKPPLMFKGFCSMVMSGCGYSQKCAQLT